MNQMQVGQILYSRLSKEQSLSGKSGYQVVGYTQARIPRSDLAEMESRFAYYPRQDSPPKRVFFASLSGRLVVAIVHRLAEGDEHGRMIGLAHGLVLEPDAVEQMPIAPLAIFDTFPFVTELQQALDLRSCPEGDLPEVTVSLPATDPGVEAIKQWSPEELRKLVFYALRAERLADRRMALAVYGSDMAILAVLRVAQLVLPQKRYAQCPMDSYFVDEHGNPCSLLGSYSWAVGMPTAPRSGNFIAIDAERRQVMDTPTWKPAGAYEHWLADKLATGRFEELVASKQGAWEVAMSLKGRDLPASVPEASVVEVQRAAPEEIRAGIHDRLAKISGAVLATRLTDAVMAQMAPADVTAHLRGEVDPQRLLKVLHETYAAARFAQPPREELSDLARFLQQAPDPLLGLLNALWQDDLNAQRQAGSSIPADDYQKVVTRLLKHGWSKPLVLVQPDRGQAFVTALLASGNPQAVPLLELVGRLREFDDQAAIDSLVPLLPEQSLDSLKALRRMCKSSRTISPGFRRALDAAYQEILANSGIGTRLRNMLPF